MSGTKVTTDPASKRNPTREGAGIITSDSLAAESLNSGGDFASTTGAAASGQPSQGTTANNTDTSGATVLDAAPDAEARQATEGWSETAALDAGRSLSSGNNAVTGSSAPTGGQQTTAQAREAAGVSKPKGTGITEGGFDSTAPNASFGTEIGTKKDPGRVGLADAAKSSAKQAADVGQKDADISGGQYDVLKDATA